MSLISAEELHLYFGSKRIFAGDSVSVEAGDRLGIVGPNGAGKSTLLKILAGSSQPDSGRINRVKGLRVGYLAQEHGDVGGEHLLGSILSTAPGKEALEETLTTTEQELALATDTGEQMRLSERLADLHSDLTELEHKFGPHRAQAILFGLGFDQADFSRPLSAFSGGWRMRGALAALLFQQPDVLLLDEPTNHLDLPSVHWLSKYLDGVKHAIVLTCHDREFLNRHVSRVASLELEGIRTFRGNYDEYLEQRALDIAHLEARIEKEAERRKQLEGFVERFKAKATKARQAQSRVKMLEKMEAGQVDLPELRRAMHVRFTEVPKSSDRVLTIERLSFSYHPDRSILRNVGVEVRRGDRVAIVGVNGAGKTTLLRLIAEELTPDEGHLEFGRGVTHSYFAQHHTEALAHGRTIIDEMRAVAPTASETRLRSLLGAVLFTGDDVDKPISVLSGGEKARVALARMLARPANLLLLDEPTNHLDTESADILTESLESFEGTIIFVSHNLDFARRLSTRVWDLREGIANNYPGDLGGYLDHLAARHAELSMTFAERGMEHVSSSPAPSHPQVVSASKANRMAARVAEKKNQAELRKQKKKVVARAEQAEAEVLRLEGEKLALEARLERPEALDPDMLRTTSEALARVSEELETAMDVWTEAEAEKENLHT